jgi:pyruvate ferredoxin oxidoreductase gamma subunit
MAFARIDDKFIRTRQQVYEPDIVVVLDSTLAQTPEVIQGLRPGGIVILNTTAKPNLQSAAKVTMVDATKIALEEIGKPFVNMPMLGALVKATNIVSLESVLKTIEERYPGEVGKKNAKAIKRTYEETR